VAITADGRRIASGDGDAVVRVWDASTGATRHTLSGHAGAVFAVAFSPDGNTLVSGSADTTVKVWDAASGKERFTLRGHTKLITGLAFSPDGKNLLSGSHDGTVRVWDVGEGKLVWEGPPCGLPVLAVAWSPNRRWVAAATGHPIELHQPGKVYVWDADRGAEHVCLRGHTSAVSAVLFTPDAQRVLTGSLDQTVRVWDTTFGLETLKLRGHNRPVTSLALSADGTRLVSAESDPSQAPGVILVRAAAPE
jgi:WD40 repeat protein